MATEHTFKLNSNEYAPEFKGREVTYTTPDTLDEIRALVHADVEDKDAVIVAGFNGQGYALGWQKRFKDNLPEKLPEGGDVDAIIAEATRKANEYRLGAPRAKGEGGTKGKVAKAEARAESALELARTMYRGLPKNLRRGMRAAILAQGVLTAEDLDAMDAES